MGRAATANTTVTIPVEDHGLVRLREVSKGRQARMRGRWAIPFGEGADRVVVRVAWLPWGEAMARSDLRTGWHFLTLGWYILALRAERAPLSDDSADSACGDAAP